MKLLKFSKYLWIYFVYASIALIVTSAIYSRLITDDTRYTIGESIVFETYPIAKIRQYFIEKHKILLWDNKLGSGSSAIGNPSYPQTYPLTYLINFPFRDQLYATRISFFIHYFLGAFFFLLLTKLLKVNIIVATVGSFFYLYNTEKSLIFQNGFRSDLIMIAWFPLILLLFIEMLITRKYIFTAFLGFVFSMLIHGGALYNTTYAAVALGIFFLSYLAFNLINNSKTRNLNYLLGLSKLFVTFIIFAFIFSAPKLLPVQESLSDSLRKDLSLESAEADVTPKYYQTIISKLTQEFFLKIESTRKINNIFKGFHVSLYLFSLASLFDRKRLKITFPIFIVFLVSLLASFGSSIPIDFYSLFYYLVPFFKSAHYTIRFLINVYFVLPLLFCLGLNFFVNWMRKIRYLNILTIVFFVLIIPPLRIFIDQAQFFIEETEFTEYSSSNVTLFSASKSNNSDPYRAILGYESPGLNFYTYESVNRDNLDSIGPYYRPTSPYFYSTISKGTPWENNFKTFSILNTKYLFIWEKEQETYNNPKFVSKVRVINEGGSVNENPVFVFEMLKTRDRPYFVTNGSLIVGKQEKDKFNSNLARKIIYSEEFIPMEQSVFSGQSPYLDDYTLEELKMFDVLILNDPLIRNQTYVDDLITTYKANGGKVIKDSNDYRIRDIKKSGFEFSEFVEEP